MSLTKDLRQSVRLMLGQRRISQRQLAIRLHTTQKHISQMLNGHTGMSLDWAEKIADVCDYDVRLVFTPREDKVGLADEFSRRANRKFRDAPQDPSTDRSRTPSAEKNGNQIRPKDR